MTTPTPQTPTPTTNDAAGGSQYPEWTKSLRLKRGVMIKGRVWKSANILVKLLFIINMGVLIYGAKDLI